MTSSLQHNGEGVEPGKGSTVLQSWRGHCVTALLFLFLIVYVSAFWGRLPRYLPEPWNRWSGWVYRALLPWWQEHVALNGDTHLQRTSLRLVLSILLGLVVPLAVLAAFRRGPTSLGLALPNRLGWRLTGVSILAAVPFGIWFIFTVHPPAGPLVDTTYLLLCIEMIPEHFLLCGVALALLLPGRSLPMQVSVAPCEGKVRQRIVRWLGLAQPPVSDRSRILTWFGLGPASLWAVGGAGLLFGLVHVGKPSPAEVLASFPGGAAAAYVTLRSRSIWPALFAHWAMNFVPLGVLAASLHCR